MDFTIKQYRELLKSLHSAGFFFQTFHEYLTFNPSTNHFEPNLLGEKPPNTFQESFRARFTGRETSQPRTPNAQRLLLRHDVDLLPLNSLRFAQIQHELGIRGTYYFRAVPESWDEKIIQEIARLGHEIGYHYENMDTCQGNTELAWDDFRRNLQRLRKLAPVTTICMHGSPRSKYDNKDLWKKYDYHTLGLLGEPYFDLTFGPILPNTQTPDLQPFHESFRAQFIG